MAPEAKAGGPTVMERTSNGWPVALALMALVGFAVVRNAMGHKGQPARQAPPERPCRVNGEPCDTVQRMQSIRGLRTENHHR
jgi:hypothetical protein